MLEQLSTVVTSTTGKLAARELQVGFMLDTPKAASQRGGGAITPAVSEHYTDAR